MAISTAFGKRKIAIPIPQREAEDNGFRGLTHKKVRKSVDRATAYTAYAVGDTIAEKSTAYALAQVFEPLFCGKHIDRKADSQEEVHKT